MSIEDYQVIQLATVHGMDNVIVHKDADGDYIFLNHGHADCADLQNVTNLRDAIVLPLLAVTEVPTLGASPSRLRAGGFRWSAEASELGLRSLVAQGAAAAAVLLHRKAQREATPDLTEDLRVVLSHQEWPMHTYLAAARRLRAVLNRGCTLVEGDES